MITVLTNTRYTHRQTHTDTHTDTRKHVGMYKLHPITSHILVQNELTKKTLGIFVSLFV
jgi:hypothetical protein